MCEYRASLNESLARSSKPASKDTSAEEREEYKPKVVCGPALCDVLRKCSMDRSSAYMSSSGCTVCRVKDRAGLLMKC